ncbi:MAG: hypothetical protein KDC80_06900 [Saprospiraceae bacterium]|nr:hypothetical protein [Saprospiraceae bacterium]
MIENGMTYIFIAIAGILLGVFFYGGLYFTTIRGLSAKHPVLWFIGSAFIRTTITLSVLYLIAGSDWKKMVICLIGFVASRPMMMKLTKEFRISGIHNLLKNETE